MKHLTDTVTWITVQDLLSSHYNVMALWRSSLREWRVANNSRVWRFSRYEEREEALYDVSCGEACDVSEIVRGKYTLVREIRGLLLSLRNDLAYTKFEARQAADHLLDLARRPPTCLRGSNYEFSECAVRVGRHQENGNCLNISASSGPSRFLRRLLV